MDIIMLLLNQKYCVMGIECAGRDSMSYVKRRYWRVGDQVVQVSGCVTIRQKYTTNRILFFASDAIDQ